MAAIIATILTGLFLAMLEILFRMVLAAAGLSLLAGIAAFQRRWKLALTIFAAPLSVMALIGAEELFGSLPQVVNLSVMALAALVSVVGCLILWRGAHWALRLLILLTLAGMAYFAALFVAKETHQNRWFHELRENTPAVQD
jgi:hypothetical protein